MKLNQSKYNVVVSDQGYHLVFNMVTSACVVFNNDDYEGFNNATLRADYEMRLKDLGILVPDDFDETKEFLNFAEKKRSGTDSLFYRILVTTCCNAHCVYCYEKSFVPISMNRETSAQVVEFIKKAAENKKHIIVQWFGGEPLLNIAEIDFITQELKNYCALHEKTYKSNIVSNGLLFYKEDIQNKLAEWCLDRVQITLDGLKDYYESIKQYSVDNAFELIISNIQFLLDNNIKVSIRLNYDEKNLQEIISLIEFLNIKFPNKGNLYVYAQQLFDEMTSLTDNIKLDLTTRVLDALYQNNFLDNVFGRLGVSFGCFASREKNFTIMPDGSLYKCSLEATVSNSCKGSISQSYAIQNDGFALPNKCKICKVLPLCYGGCLVEKQKGNNYCLISEATISYLLLLSLRSFLRTI